MSVITQRGYFPHFQHVLQRADPLRQVLVVMRQVQRVQRQTRYGGQRRRSVGPTPGAGGWLHRLRTRSGHQVVTIKTCCGIFSVHICICTYTQYNWETSPTEHCKIGQMLAAQLPHEIAIAWLPLPDRSTSIPRKGIEGPTQHLSSFTRNPRALFRAPRKVVVESDAWQAKNKEYTTLTKRETVL